VLAAELVPWHPLPPQSLPELFFCRRGCLAHLAGEGFEFVPKFGGGMPGRRDG
jgi:hypothetical protein